MPTPQNGQTHSNNSSAICQRIVWVGLIIIWDWRLKGSGTFFIKLLKDNYSREQIQLTEKDGKSLESFSEDFTELVGEMTEKNKK